ncbi:MAG: hypothetical protein QW286_02550 [Candidatus Aenigmatarchaeota archaeon]
MGSDVMLTFDTLSRIAREEKSSASLTKLPEGFFDEVIQYLNNKKRASEVKDESWEAESANMVLNDILRARERKILLSAILFLDSGTEPANLTPEERSFFSKATEMIANFRNERKKLLEQGRNRKSVVAFLEDVTEFVGSDMKNYGPFSKGDVASLPEDVSEVLVERGAARFVEPQTTSKKPI